MTPQPATPSFYRRKSPNLSMRLSMLLAPGVNSDRWLCPPGDSRPSDPRPDAAAAGRVRVAACARNTRLPCRRIATARLWKGSDLFYSAAARSASVTGTSRIRERPSAGRVVPEFRMAGGIGPSLSDRAAPGGSIPRPTVEPAARQDDDDPGHAGLASCVARPAGGERNPCDAVAERSVRQLRGAPPRPTRNGHERRARFRAERRSRGP
jgi:hypothetical protein